VSRASDHRPRAGWDLPAMGPRARVLSLHWTGGSRGSSGRVEDAPLLLDPPHALTTSATIVALMEASRVSDGVSRSGRRSLTALLAFGDRIYSDLGRPERARHRPKQVRAAHRASGLASRHLRDSLHRWPGCRPGRCAANPAIPRLRARALSCRRNTREFRFRWPRGPKVATNGAERRIARCSYRLDPSVCGLGRETAVCSWKQTAGSRCPERYGEPVAARQGQVVERQLGSRARAGRCGGG
jgi:hypothetical protein